MAETKPKTIAEETKDKDFIDAIGGTLTLEKAKHVFGESKAIDAMRTFAQAGGHGLFDASELTSPLFGGLAMPEDAKTRAEINTVLNNLK